MTIGCALIAAVSGLCFASRTIYDRGVWPESWPAELDEFRAQGKTVITGTGFKDVWETSHEISFSSREKFERAWPHILSLMGEGSSIILERTPSKRWSTPIRAGVRILCPSSGPVINGLHSPEHLDFESGTRPEYIVAGRGWHVAYDGDNGDAVDTFILRARVDIVLVVDGKIVDMNRIPLLDNTPIIDNRFK